METITVVVFHVLSFLLFLLAEIKGYFDIRNFNVDFFSGFDFTRENGILTDRKWA